MHTSSNPAARERSALYFKKAAEAAKDWFDADGNWISTRYPYLITRERYWLALGLYAAGETAFADAVVRKGELDLKEYSIASTFNIFHTNIALVLLLQHRDEMASDVRQTLEMLVRDGFSKLPGNRQPDYQFHGYNDNMPSKATMGMILGGEMLNAPEVVEHGIWNLKQLRAQLRRRGINSECNSPTYSPLTVHAMAEIATYTRSEEAREIALGVEQRLWFDLASRFHPRLGVQAGGYSRAYTIDCLSHLSCLTSFLWFEFGDLIKPSPLDLFQPDNGFVLHHMGNVAFNVAQMCWFPAHYHIPEAARALFLAKSYPHEATATAEFGDFGPDFPARPFRIKTRLEKDFAVGTVSTPLGGGEQTMCYFANYARTEEVASYKDRGTIYSKIVINGEDPGEIVRDTEKMIDGSECECSGESDNLTGRSNPLAFQSANTVLYLTHPHLSLGGSGDDSTVGATPLSDLSEMIILPSHFAGADEILVDGETRQSWSGAVRKGAWIACRRGRLLVAFRPLVYTRTLGEPEIRLEKINNYEVIRTVFYHGEARVFSRLELKHTFGGFVAEHASVDEYASLADFVKDLESSQFTDYLWTTRRVTYRRPAGAARPALEMEVSCSPGSCTPRFALINGDLVNDEQKPVDLQGVDEKTLPFLNDPWEPLPAYFPWEKIEVAWANPTISAIGDKQV